MIGKAEHHQNLLGRTKHTDTGIKLGIADKTDAADGIAPEITAT